MRKEMMANAHPSEGDGIVLTDIVHDRAILGLSLPCGFKLAETDQTFDEIHAEVLEVEEVRINGRLSRDRVRILTENGVEATLDYRGREPIAGSPGASMSMQNSQGAQQSYVWEHA